MSRRRTVLLLLGITCASLSACRHQASFDENYKAGIDSVKKGRYELARAQFQRAYLQNQEDIENKYQLALVEFKLNDAHSAYSLLRAAEEKDRSSAVSVPVRFELAKLFLASKQFDQAQKRLTWVLQKDPANKEARGLLAVTLASMAQPAEAREQVKLLVEADPGSVGGNLLDASLHLAANEASDAEKILQDQVRLTQRSSDSLIMLANFYQLVRQPAAALPLIQEVLQRDPKNIGVRTELGWVYAQAGDRVNAEKTFREVTQIPGADQTAVMALANYYVNAADWPKTIAELEAQTKKKPDAQTRGILASAYFRAGRRADAEALAMQLIKENSQDSTAHLLIGMIHLDAKEYDLAVSEFDHVLHFQTDSAPAAYLLALASYGSGKEQVALQQMQRALEINKEMLAARMWLIDFHLRHGSKDAALDWVRSAPPSMSSFPEIVVMSALCDPSADLSAEQQRILQDALIARPRMILYYQGLGMDTILRKYGAPLRDQLDALVRKYPALRPAQTLLVAVLEAQGKPDQALAQVEKQVAGNPKSVSDLLTLAKLQVSRNDFPAAHETLAKASALQPANPEILIRTAEVDANMGHLDAALDELNTLTERYPKVSEAWSLKAIIYQQRGQPREARSFYEEALKRDGRNIVALNNLALLLASPDFKDLAGGLDLVRKAHAIDPSNPEISDSWGWIEYRSGHYTEALKILTDAVKLRPDDAGIKLHLGMAQSHAGRGKEALASLEAALKLDPKLPEANEARAEIATLKSKPVH